MSEWLSFRERERVANLPDGLIAPIKFHDGEHFPPEAQKRQWVDVSKYAFTFPAFWETERALELEDLLKDLAKDVSRMIANAPAFRPNWPVVDRPNLLPQPQVVLERL
jgi:hypothetical protein